MTGSEGDQTTPSEAIDYRTTLDDVETFGTDEAATKDWMYRTLNLMERMGAEEVQIATKEQERRRKLDLKAKSVNKRIGWWTLDQFLLGYNYLKIKHDRFNQDGGQSETSPEPEVIVEGHPELRIHKIGHTIAQSFLEERMQDSGRRVISESDLNQDTNVSTVWYRVIEEQSPLDPAA